MGEAMAWAALAVCGSAAGYVLVTVVRRLVSPSLAAGLTPPALAQRDASALTRRAVRKLQHLLERDDLVPFLSEKDRREMEEIVSDYDKV